ncbi:MAG: YhjD/YihY/BrkB family envelope integrity protein [bacterium]
MKKLSLRQGLSNFFHRLREFFTIEHLRRTFVHFKDGVRIAWKIFNEKGVLSHASVCSYSMILSLVPILAISLAILNAFSPTNADITTEELLQQSEQAALLEETPATAASSTPASEDTGQSEITQSPIQADTETDQAVTRNPASDAAQDAPIADPIRRGENFTEQVFDFFFRNFVPGINLEQDTEVEIAKRQLIAIIQRAASLRFVILVFLIVTSVSLFYSIEHAFNEIWSVRNRRSLFSQFLAFWILLTVTPLLLGLSYYYTNVIVARYFQENAPEKLVIFYNLVSFTLTLFAFMIANRFLPNVRVYFLPAFIASALSAMMFEVAKIFFDFYISSVTSQAGNYYTIFQKLAAIPIFILWLYYCFLCFLIGPVIATTIQNFDQHVAHLYRYSWRYSPRPIQAIYIFIHICRAFRQNKTGVTLSDLDEETGILPEHLRRNLRSLEQAQLVHMDRQGRFYPNADPATLTVGEVLQQVIGLEKERDDRIHADQKHLNEILHNMFFSHYNLPVATLLDSPPPSNKILLHQKS